MNLMLDAESEKRIQREIDLGHYNEPPEAIAHVLSLPDTEDDLPSDMQAIEEHLDEGFAQIQRGEGIPGEEARAYFIRNHAARATGQSVESASEFFRRRAAGANGDALGRALDAVPSRPPDPSADFFRRRSQGAGKFDAKAFLHSAPDVPPIPGDELPEDWQK